MYRVWHICQIGAVEPFYVKVESIEGAKMVLILLWNYDLFQYNNNIKPDYANASGLEVYDEKTKEWEEYYNEDGEDILEIIRNEQEDISVRGL